MDTEGLLRSLKGHKIDIFIRPSRLHASRTWHALQAFGYDMSDLHPFVTGVSFGRIWRNKVKAKYGGTAVYFASLGDLIVMKRAAGRPKDREDLKYLVRLKKRGPA